MDVEKTFHMNGGSGENSYAQNSFIQKNDADKIKHITLKYLEETYISTIPNSLGIADLGCASGQNALSFIREMVGCIDETSSKLSNIPAPPEYRMCLNDLPTNDFNSLFKILPSFHTELKNQRHHKFDSNIFIGAYPGTFYGRLFPDECLHFIYSYYCLHWLSRVPLGLYDKEGKSINKGNIHISKTSSVQVLKAYSNQFQEDFSMFLGSRAKELEAEGRMVLTLSGTRDPRFVDRDSSFLFEILSRAFALLVSKGQVKQEMVDEYNSHYYSASKSEIEEAVKKQGSFKIDHFEIIEMELKSAPCLSRGTTVAKAIRAVQESMISHHFGEDILDNLFDVYGRLIDEEMDIDDIKPVNFIIVLQKM